MKARWVELASQSMRRCSLGRAFSWRDLGVGFSASVLVIAAAPASALATPNFVISRYAGTGTSGPTPVPGPATSSPLTFPMGVAVAGDGTAYIADEATNRVLKVTPAGALSVFAGNGNSGAPTPGPATSSRLGGPFGMAVDASGDVYIADPNNYVVEKVTPAGVLSVIAGNGSSSSPVPGPATSSPLSYPQAVAVDAGGNVYIADANSYRVLKVTPSGTLSYFAGSGTSGAPIAGPATSSPLGGATGLAADASGNVYIADANHSVVEKVTSAGVLSVVAGNGTYGAPTAGPALSSRLGSPRGVALDSSGNLYIVDTSEGEIDMVTPAGALSIVAGTGLTGPPSYGGAATSSRLDVPRSLAVTPTGGILVADTTNTTVDLLVAAVPSSVSVPAVTGTAAPGQTLTSDQASWTNTPVSYAYQWEDCDANGANCTAIAGATNASYLLSSSDLGDTVRVILTAINSGGSATSTSAASALIQDPTPTTATTTTTVEPTATTTTTSPPSTTASITTPTPPTTTASGPAQPEPGCPVPSGALSQTALGPLRLGMTAAQARTLMPQFADTKNGFERFCLTASLGIRVHYATATTSAGLSPTARARLRGRIFIALTANPHYGLDGIRPNTPLHDALANLMPTKPFHVGLNLWYIIPAGLTDEVLKVQDGVIQEIGIINHVLVSDRRSTARLLRNL